jgi:hypothetical protein
MTCLFWAVGFVLVIRSLAGWEPLFKWSVITAIATPTVAPVGFLAGLGAFDFWAHYASGRPTRADDHSRHGAHS